MAMSDSNCSDGMLTMSKQQTFLRGTIGLLTVGAVMGGG
ncbi:hypothetical protein NIES2104_00630 [Leptolyngbya sp. NIES-2104]|nr:hypothetical protein NIES2104_00630 [Leptolyngbya sp. NIES-2104]